MPPAGGLNDGSRTVPTAMFKQPVLQPIYLGQLGFAGDEQVDRVHHGGLEKAVCLYPYDHYAYWQRTLGRPLPTAAFGENLTVAGLTETVACIGDAYRVGEAVIQICQPRIPCFKVAARLETPDMVDRMLASGYTGFYFRVLQEGYVGPGDQLQLVDRPAGAPTVAEATRIRFFDRENPEVAGRLLAAVGLAEAWRTHLERRLGG